MIIKRSVLVLSILLSFLSEPSSLILGEDPLYSTEKIDGITMVAPPRAFPSDPMVDVKAIGAGWISSVPYGFVRLGSHNIRYNLSRQWWGERKEGIEKTIEYAHANGIKVMLKPQIWSPDGWIGDQDFEKEEDWISWERAYKEYILFYAELAAEYEVEMFCVGTELKQHMIKRPQYFHELIKDIRSIYCGKLIYSANWDSYQQVSFWEELDYIGLSAYFPINEKKTPSVSYLTKKWKPVVVELRAFSQSKKRPIVFTEYGYLSVDGSGGKTWILEKNVRKLPVNEEAQANCFEALYKVFENESFWAGGFIWKWFPFNQGGEGYNDRDYTPQGKKAEEVIAHWYTKW